MGKIIKVIDEQTIELISYRNPNICFNTNEYQGWDYYCDFREQINPFELYSKNKEQGKEIARLNKIIDELEKTINECSILGEYGTSRMFIEKDYLLNKLKELKEKGDE